MPQFITISPTDIKGNKPYAWNNFLKGGYIAIGWGHTDYTNYSINEIINDIKNKNLHNERDAIHAFTNFKALKSGDVVAINNVNHGLFGVGRINLDYKFEMQIHDTGSDKSEDFYSHYRKVKWIVTEYKTINELMLPGKKSWTRHGTMGKLEESLPPYILRLLDRYIRLDYSKIEPINSTLKGFFSNGILKCEVGDLMPVLIREKLFSQSSGVDFREYLRNLYTLERLNLIPYAHFDFEHSSKRWYFKSNQQESEKTTDSDIELIGYEGKVQSELREHKWIERDLVFKRNVKAKFKKIMKCEGCQNNIKQRYGIDAIEFLELHHIVPLSLRKNSINSITKESDIALICPNCHKTIHKLMSIKNNSIVSIFELQQYLKAHQ